MAKMMGIYPAQGHKPTRVVMGVETTNIEIIWNYVHGYEHNKDRFIYAGMDRVEQWIKG